MSTPYITPSDSENEHSTAPDIHLSDSDFDVNTYILTPTQGFPVTPSDSFIPEETIPAPTAELQATPYISTPTLEFPVAPFDSFIPEEEHTIPAPTAEPQATPLPSTEASAEGDDINEELADEHDPPEDSDDPDYTPSSGEPMETDPLGDEEESEEEDPSGDDSDTADTYPTPPTTILSPHPRSYRRNVVVRGGVCIRATTRESVPRPHISSYDRNYRDLHLITTTLTSITTIPIPLTTTSTPIPTIPIFTTTPIPTTYWGSRVQRGDWLPATLQSWRQQEGLPSTYEVGESSSAPPMATYIQDPAIPILVARLERQERAYRSLEQDFERYKSRNAANLRRSFDSVKEDVNLTDQAVDVTHNQVMHTQGNVTSLQSRVEACERRIAELERLVRELSRHSPRGSSSKRPGHPPK